MNKTMKAAQINRYGADAVEINPDAPPPVPEKGKIVVKVHAAGVNPFDWKLREGYMQSVIALTFPATLGGDFSGVAVETGEEVYGQAIVVGGGSGSFAEFALAPTKSIARKPKAVSHLEAAAIPLTGVSALQVLTEHMQLSAGQEILIHGGAGGIGTMAIQVAKHIGAYVATTATGDELTYVKELGADEAIDYKKQRFEEVVQNYDAVFDTVGGETYARSFQVLKKGGVVVSMIEQPNEALMKQQGATAIAQNTRVTTERLEKLAALVDQGTIKVHIDKIFPLEEAGEALTYLQTGHPRGKVVIQVREN